MYPKDSDYGDDYYDKYDCYFNDGDWLDRLDACSSNDCTGMVPSGPGDTKELEDYQEIYQFGKLDIEDVQ